MPSLRAECHKDTGDRESGWHIWEEAELKGKKNVLLSSWLIPAAVEPERARSPKVTFPWHGTMFCCSCWETPWYLLGIAVPSPETSTLKNPLCGPLMLLFETERLGEGGENSTNCFTVWHSYIWPNLDAKGCIFFVFDVGSPGKDYPLAKWERAAPCYNYSYFHYQ